MNLLVDAQNLAHRARHAYNLSFHGKDTSVTYGVIRMLMALLHKYKPTSVLFAWDGGTPGFRRRLVSSYKSNRSGRELDSTWQAFLDQMHELEQILPHTGIMQVRRRGIEADDLLYHASRMVEGHNLIVSTDDDMLQCVNDKVDVLHPGKVDKITTLLNFERSVGYPVYKYVASKVLQGDGSDNVPGVLGIGPKTVKALLKHSDVVAAATPKVRERIHRFIESGQYNASYTVMDLSVDRTGARQALLDAQWQPYDKRVYQWCIERGFTSLIEAGLSCFGSLQQPAMNGELLRSPRIWDYGRDPIENDNREYVMAKVYGEVTGAWKHGQE